MMDRATVEEAIRTLKGWWMHGSAETFDTLDRQRIQAVCEAAEAHLATLPREKKWGVSVGNCGGWVHFDTFAEALDALKVEAAAGRAVTIEHRVQA